MGDDNEKLNDLNGTLGNIENQLLHRALGRSRDDAERAYDCINQGVEAGVIDLDCDGCEDDGVEVGQETAQDDSSEVQDDNKEEK